MRFLAVVLLCAASACSAQVYGGSSGISVSGDAEIKVVPDRVTLFLGVGTRSKNLAAASSENDALVRKVIAATQKLQVEASDIQTDFIHVDLAYVEHAPTEVDYYSVTKEIQIVVKDVSRFESLLQAVLGAGANHIYGIEFATSELRKYRDQARALAVKAAIEKANDLAAAAGLKVVGKPLALTTYSYGGGSSYRYCCGPMYSSGMSQNVVQNAGGGGELGADSALALGKISVSASVSLSFQIQ